MLKTPVGKQYFSKFVDKQPITLLNITLLIGKCTKNICRGALFEVFFHSLMFF